MKKLLCFILATASLMPLVSIAQEMNPVVLPTPRMYGGKPLMEVLKNRQTTREYGDKKLSDQVLSNLLWAADGINRPDSKKRTAPSAMNYQETDVYVCTADGVYLYDALNNSLIPQLKEDIRAMTGKQDFVKTAPVNIVLVADYARMTKSDEATKEMYGMADAAYVSENIYLFCGSEGLVTGVRAMIDKEALSKAMNLRPEQHIMLAHSVGYAVTK